MSRGQRLKINLFQKNLYPAIVFTVLLIMMAAIF